MSKHDDKKYVNRGGLSTTRTYHAYWNMIDRCYNKVHRQYKDYGARGTTVYDTWRDDLLNFIADMGMKSNDQSIDRIDNAGNYCRQNCRWATPSEQARNTRQNVWIEYDGEMRVAIDLAAKLHIDVHVI